MAATFIITNVYATRESRDNARIETPVAAHPPVCAQLRELQGKSPLRQRLWSLL